MTRTGQNFSTERDLLGAYYLHGKEHRESTKQTDEKEAQKYLSKVLKQVHAAQIGARTFTTPKSSRLTIGDLVGALRTRFELDGKLSAQNKSELRPESEEDFGTSIERSNSLRNKFRLTSKSGLSPVRLGQPSTDC